MALKKIGVPTEMILYPNMPHGLVNPKYAYVKMMADITWFDRWILGKEGWIDWGELMASIEGGPQ
jgi:dipeptidyl aminopeptidase/acylaminoacyl peptidase